MCIRDSASDIHMGSTKFLEKDWDRMMEWMNSEHNVAKNIKYLVLSGDCVDGVGIYPGQDNELAIKDLYGQYTKIICTINFQKYQIVP